MKNFIISLLVAGLAVTSVAQTAPKAAPKAAPAPKAALKAGALTKESVKAMFDLKLSKNPYSVVDTNLTAEQVATVVQQLPVLEQNWETLKNSAEWAAFKPDQGAVTFAVVLEYLRTYEGVVAAASNLSLSATSRFADQAGNPMAHYAKGFVVASSLLLVTKDNGYVSQWITNNINLLPVMDRNLTPNQSLKVVDQVSVKKLLVHDLAFLVAFQEGNLTSIVPTCKRLEIMERRAAGLTVIGADALPKTAALTAAINSGNGLAEALQAFVGTDLPLSTMVAKKKAAAQALKAEFDAGLKDPKPYQVALIGSWLGIEPTAEWVKRYNGQ